MFVLFIYYSTYFLNFKREYKNLRFLLIFPQISKRIFFYSYIICWFLIWYLSCYLASTWEAGKHNSNCRWPTELATWHSKGNMQHCVSHISNKILSNYIINFFSLLG